MKNSFTYYEILKVNYNATQEDIKKAFRIQARKWHPDMNPNSDTTEIMKKINLAYETLSDLNLRKKYDSEIIRTTQTSDVNKDTTTAYKSYTKTREESESDFEDWIKEYLNRRRYLNKLYKALVKIEGQNINLRKNYLNPSSLDLETSKLLLEEIKKEWKKFFESNQDSPIKILNYLFEELSQPVNNVGNAQRNYLNSSPNDEMLQNLILSEITLVLNKYTKPDNEYYPTVINYLLEKYLLISTKNIDIRKSYLEPTPYQNLMEEFLMEVLKMHSKYLKNLLDKNNIKL